MLIDDLLFPKNNRWKKIQSKCIVVPEEEYSPKMFVLILSYDVFVDTKSKNIFFNLLLIDARYILSLSD